MQALPESQLAELFIWLSRKYPHAKDPNRDGGFVSPRDSIAWWRDELLRHLKQLGTQKACEAIQYIINELPYLDWLKWTLLDARAATRQNTWLPPQPRDILELTKCSETRLVQDDELLCNVVIESLTRLEEKLHPQLKIDIAYLQRSYTLPLNLLISEWNSPIPAVRQVPQPKSNFRKSLNLVQI